MEPENHIEGCPALQIPKLSPPCWLKNPHLQTLWPKFVRLRPQLALTRERLELEDGDFIDLAWVAESSGPIVLMIHGLEGNLRSHYALPILNILACAGFRPVFMYLRGASGEPNRLPRTYHSGAAEDLAEVLALLRKSGRPVAGAIGFSLGANLLLRYLGMNGKGAGLEAAMAVSVPFVLADASRRLDQGASLIYRNYLMHSLKRTYVDKCAALGVPVEMDLKRIRAMHDYDELITAPLNGFTGADDYYNKCSCIHYLGGITVPTLILHSLDDPFMYPSNVPSSAIVGPGVELAIQAHGGHVGFIEDGRCRIGDSLIDRLAPTFFRSRLLGESPS